MQQPLNDLQWRGDIWKWKTELQPFCGKETFLHLDSKRAPNVWKINSFQPVVQFPMKASVLHNLIKNEDMSVGGNGNQSVGWSRPWPGKEAAQLVSRPRCPPTGCRVQQPPGTWAVYCQKLHFSAVKVPAQQRAGSSDHTALSFFLGVIRVSLCLGQWMSPIQCRITVLLCQDRMQTT